MKTHRVAWRALGAVLVGAIAMMGACGSIRVSGRVVNGRAGIPLIVPATDARVADGAGVPDVSVEVVRDTGEHVTIATTDAVGNFVLSLPSASAPTRAVTIKARGKTIAPVDGTLYLPRDGSRILILVQPLSNDSTIDVQR